LPSSLSALLSEREVRSIVGTFAGMLPVETDMLGRAYFLESISKDAT